MTGTADRHTEQRTLATMLTAPLSAGASDVSGCAVAFPECCLADRTLKLAGSTERIGF